MSSKIGEVAVHQGMLKVLSIRQPWAWAIVHAGKRIENRTWTTSYRGLFLVHASGKPELDAWDDVEEISGERPPRTLPLGAIVGAASLEGVVRDSEDPWFCGPYGFVLAGVRALPAPIAVSGRLGFWTAPAAVEERVRAWLSESA